MSGRLGSAVSRAWQRLFGLPALVWTWLRALPGNTWEWTQSLPGKFWRRFNPFRKRPEFSDRPPLLIRVLRIRRKLERIDTTGKRTMPERPQRLRPSCQQFHTLRINTYVCFPLAKLIWKLPLQAFILGFTLLVMDVTLRESARIGLLEPWLIELFLAWCVWQYLEAYWFVTTVDARKDRLFWTRGILKPTVKELGAEDIEEVQLHSYWWATLFHIDVGIILVKTAGSRDDLKIPLVAGVDAAYGIFQGIDRTGGQQIQQELMALIARLLSTGSVPKSEVDGILGEGTCQRWMDDDGRSEARDMLSFMRQNQRRPRRRTI